MIEPKPQDPKSIPPFELRYDFVEEVVNPEVSYRPMGVNEALSDYLYKTLRQMGNPDIMIAFVEMTEDFINFEELDSELNAIKALRALKVLVDMPDDVPTAVRAAALASIFSSEWLHFALPPFQMSQPIAGVKRKGAELVTDLRFALGLELIEKMEEFWSVERSSVIVNPDVGDFSFLDYMDSVGELAEDREAQRQYMAIVGMANVLSELSLD